jgi:hypothetical protein
MKDAGPLRQQEPGRSGPGASPWPPSHMTDENNSSFSALQLKRQKADPRACNNYDKEAVTSDNSFVRLFMTSVYAARTRTYPVL